MSRPRELLGKIFGRLTVQSRAENSINGQTRWVCLCSCGVTKIVYGSHLVRGLIRSCRCLQREGGWTNTTHGHTKPKRSPTYISWQNAKRRCVDPNNNRFEYYGARGIKMCKRWFNSFENFLSDMGKRPAGKTLDRKNVNGNYTPKNCKWSSMIEQRNNRRKK